MFSLAQIFVALSCTIGYTLAAPTPQSTSASSHSGDLTYYQPGLGACGETNSDSEHVVALSVADYDGNCGKTIQINKDGKTASALVADKCMGCAAGSIDVSSTVFESLADLSEGRVKVTWTIS
ncbi:Uu.00g107210.m01.CDS01 [Anthostomella pinea]|uniref:Uu.00g107210.m01.CDS01 n=1 Tax=Anthostomella pinea TaxID=933095 RepID=A0AAI8YFY6_9PEZI|nr:Uu.00g107210.m01.CDS01 [Anthostomella pinea]